MSPGRGSSAIGTPIMSYRPHLVREAGGTNGNVEAMESSPGLARFTDVVARDDFTLDQAALLIGAWEYPERDIEDRKSTRLNSSHTVISYAVFCLKKKKKK